jgi:hypothetical protein
VRYNGSDNISPIIHKLAGKLCDLRGVLRGTFFSEELKYIISRGGVVVKTHSALTYKRGKILESFSRGLYEERSNSKAHNVVFKLILNSGYGRFAMQKHADVCKILTSEQAEIVNDIYPTYATDKFATNKLADYCLVKFNTEFNQGPLDEHLESDKSG